MHLNQRERLLVALGSAQGSNCVPCIESILPKARAAQIKNAELQDPVALFRKKLPLDSYAMKALPEEEKQVPISIMLDDGEAFPANTKIVWPYTCTRR